MVLTSDITIIMLNKTLSEKFYFGLKWKGLTQVSVYTSQLLVTIIMARLLLPKDFGLLGIVQIFIAFSTTIVNMTIKPALIQKKEITADDMASGNFIALIFGVLFLFLFWVGSYPLSIFFKIRELNGIMKIFGFKFIFDSMSIVSLSILRREIDYKSLFFISSVSIVVGQGCVPIVLALLNFGVYSLVFGSISASIILFVSSFVIFRKKGYSFRIKYYKKEIIYILKFGLWTTFTNLVNLVAIRGDYFIIGKWLNTYLLGIYTKSYYLMQFGSTAIVEVFSNVLFPVLSRIQENKKKIKDFLIGFIPIMALIVMSIMIFVIFYSEEIIMVVLGDKWSFAIAPLKTLAFFGVFRGVYKIFDSVILSLGKVKFQFFIHSLYAILIIVSTLVGLKWGIIGISYGVGISIFIVSLLLAFYTSNIVNLQIKDWMLLLKPIVIYGSLFFIAIYIFKIKIHCSNYFFSLLFGIIFFLSLWVVIIVYLKLKYFNSEFYVLFESVIYLFPISLRKYAVRIINDQKRVKI